MLSTLGEMQAVGELLRDPDSFNFEDKIEALQALAALATTQPLPDEILLIVSELLLDRRQSELHESCFIVFGTCAGGDNHQLLPPSTIQILEVILEYANDNLLNLTAAVLSGVLKNKQRLSSQHILQLTEAALLRQQHDTLDITAFVYQLTMQPDQQGLSGTTFEALCAIILDPDESQEKTQEQCYNIIVVNARNGHEVPSIIFETLTLILQQPQHPFYEKAFDVLITCVTKEKNRRNIPPEIFNHLMAATEQVLLEDHPKMKQYAACIAGNCLRDQPRGLDEWLNIQMHPAFQLDALIDILEETLINPQMAPHAVSPLSHLLNEKTTYGLFPKSMHALKKIIKAPDQRIDLQQTSIELMGLSLRNSRNVFSEEEFDQFESIFKRNKPELTQSCLKANQALRATHH